MRTKVNALLRSGGVDALQEAARLVSEADWMSIVPEGDDLPERVWTSLRGAGHPLGWLRSRITPIERGVFSLRPLPTSAQAFPRGGAASFDRVEVNVPGSLVAFSSMCERSNGLASSVAVRLAEPASLSADTVLAVARHLHRDQKFAGAASVSHEEALFPIIQGAVCGGAYDHGSGAALGRLYAWRTICWLMSRQPDMKMNDAIKVAERLQWLSFDQDERWLFSGAVGCHDIQAQRLAIVAWCDVD